MGSKEQHLTGIDMRASGGRDRSGSLDGMESPGGGGGGGGGIRHRTNVAPSHAVVSPAQLHSHSGGGGGGGGGGGASAAANIARDQAQQQRAAQERRDREMAISLQAREKDRQEAAVAAQSARDAKAKSEQQAAYLAQQERYKRQQVDTERRRQERRRQEAEMAKRRQAAIDEEDDCCTCCGNAIVGTLKFVLFLLFAAAVVRAAMELRWAKDGYVTCNPHFQLKNAQHPSALLEAPLPLLAGGLGLAGCILMFTGYWSWLRPRTLLVLFILCSPLYMIGGQWDMSVCGPGFPSAQDGEGGEGGSGAEGGKGGASTCHPSTFPCRLYHYTGPPNVRGRKDFVLKWWPY